MTIQIMTRKQSSMIAAGEVIERPASIVKELVENSLDAGAKFISVEVKNGGIGSIRVVDDGSGISSFEVETAFRRFATSKFLENDDLFAVETLGFRGEALPSIASICSLTMLTRTVNQHSGILLRINNGEISTKSDQGCPIGTSVLIEELFQEVPARLKFLKSIHTESKRINSLVQQFSIAFPGVGFRLVVDGRTSLNTSGDGVLRNACSEIFGFKTANSMIEISSDGNDYARVTGLISPTDIARSNRSYINLVLNGRFVQNRSLVYAVENSYKGFLTVGRYPIVVVHVNVPAKDLDFNVHPAKTEVRLKEENLVFDSIQRSLRSSLISLSPIPTSTSLDSINRSFGAFRKNPYPNPRKTFQDALALFDKSENIDDYNYRDGFKNVLPYLKIIGQVQNLYIVTEGGYGMYLIDQHAAHERVLYEKIQSEIQNNMVNTQGFLEPLVINLSPVQHQVLTENIDSWRTYGFDIENFGSNSVLLRSMPVDLNNMSPTETFLSILDEATSEEISSDFDSKICASLACHGAVRAGDKLDALEMENLLRQLQETNQPNNCAHGRPTTIVFRFDQLAKDFLRT